MCAGCSAEERERAESDVRRALGARASGGETWIVSVINLQSRWSVTLDGPGIRALNCTASPGRLAESIEQALQAKIGAPPAASAPPPAARAAPAPAAPAAPPARTGAAPTAPGRVPAAPPTPAAGRAATPPTRAAAPVPAPAAPRPGATTPAPAAAPAARPTVSAASGPRRVPLECVQCHQRFHVTFEAIAGEPEHMTPVACPHCWHMNQVLIGETAADTSDYRAEKG